MRLWRAAPLLLLLLMAITTHDALAARKHKDGRRKGAGAKRKKAPEVEQPKYYAETELAAAFAAKPGVMLSFEHPVYSNGYFLGFEGWENAHKRFGATNVTFVVRVSFRGMGFREQRLRKRYLRFWLPGAFHVELATAQEAVFLPNLTEWRSRNRSQVDIWVTPECFVRNNGVERVHRVARVLKMQVASVRWLAKINFAQEEGYGPKELVEVGKALIKIAGLQCAWIHPYINSSFSLMVRFKPGDVPKKRFFSPTSGYSEWGSLNEEYQVSGVRFLRGWNRALLDFRGGLACAESQNSIAKRYLALASVAAVFPEKINDCRFTYQIILAFDRKFMTPAQVRVYQHWADLNRVYGAVDVNLASADDMRAVLEFEPGLYTSYQMHAIRNEYLKLPGIRFGWVLGLRAADITTFVLCFSPEYLRRVALRDYHLWNGLNNQVAANVTWLEESTGRAFVQLPVGRYSDVQLRGILRKYRHLPGIVAVRVDSAPAIGANLTKLAAAHRRTLPQWVHLSNGDSPRLLLAADNDTHAAAVNMRTREWNIWPCISEP